MIPLTFSKEGTTSIIKKIGGRDSIRQHLAELGFVSNEKVNVVSKNGSNMIVAIKGSRIALDRDMANRIMC